MVRLPDSTVTTTEVPLTCAASRHASAGTITHRSQRFRRLIAR